VARRWKVLIATSVAVFMALLDVTIVNIAFPDIRTSFPHDSLSDLSWILNGYNIVFAGRIGAGRPGRPEAAVHDRRAGVRGRVDAVRGVSFRADADRGQRAAGDRRGDPHPASLSLILPEFPVEQRATATALWTATGAVAAATGPSLGGVLVDWQGWRAVFFVNVVIGLPALIPAQRLLRESKDTQAGRGRTGSGRRCWRSGPARWRWGSSRARSGDGRPATWSVPSWPPPCCSPCLLSAPPGTPHP
jgi:MFS family permease